MRATNTNVVCNLGLDWAWVQNLSLVNTGSHFFRLTKFHDISMIFPGFLVNFQVFFSLILKYDFKVVLNIKYANLLNFI